MKKKKLIRIIIGITVAALVLPFASIGIYDAMLFNKARRGNEWLNMTITAHTGCMGTRENSFASMKTGAENADIIEFDLHFLSDGTPVLAHDRPKGGEMTYRQAARLIAETEGIRVNVDIKSTKNLKEVVKISQQEGILDRIFFTGVKDSFVEAVKNDAPEVEYYLNVDVKKRKRKNDEYINSLIEKVKSSGAIGINCNYKNISGELVNKFKAEGLLVSLWTVDKKHHMLKCIGYKPDNITTRHPDELKKQLDAVLYVG